MRKNADALRAGMTHAQSTPMDSPKGIMLGALHVASVISAWRRLDSISSPLMGED
jgi:hypothetical protein